MSEIIQGGVLTDFIKKFVGLSTALAGAIGKIVDWGIKIQDAQETKDKGFKLKLLTNGGMTIFVEGIPTSKEDVYDLIFTDEDKNVHKESNVPADKVDDKIAETIKDIYGEDVKAKYNEDVNSVTKHNNMQVCLCKTSCADGKELRLQEIRASYGIDNAYSDLNYMLDYAPLTEYITETPVILDITDIGDNYDVQIVPEFTIADTCLQELFTCACTTLMHIRNLYWESSKEEDTSMYSVYGKYVYELYNELDTLAYYYIQKYGCVPTCTVMGNCSQSTSYSCAYNVLTKYVYMLQCCYVNLCPDLQQYVEDKIYFWNAELENFTE